MPWEHIGKESVLRIFLVLNNRIESSLPAYLKLGLTEPGDLDDHVVGLVGSVHLCGHQRYIMPGRQWSPIIIGNVHAMLGVWIFRELLSSFYDIKSLDDRYKQGPNDCF